MFRYCLIIFFVLVFGLVYSQSQVDSLERVLNESFGKNKLLVLNQLTKEYLASGDAKKAVKYARQAQFLADDVISTDNELIRKAELRYKPVTYILLGKAYYLKEDYYSSKDIFEQALVFSLETNEPQLAHESRIYLAKLDSLVDSQKGNFLGRKLKNLKIGDMISSSSSDLNLTTTLKLAEAYENKQNYEKAIDQYQKAINLLRDKGDSEQVIVIRKRIAEIYERSGNLEQALANYQQIRDIKEQSSDSNALVSIEEDMDDVIGKMENVITKHGSQVERKTHEKITAYADPIIEKKRQESDKLKELATQFEKEKDYAQSLSYYKLYIEASEKLEEEEHTRELALLEQTNQLENKANQITMLEQEKKLQELNLANQQTEIIKQKRFRNNLIAGSVLLLSLALALYFLYNNKKNAHLKLQTAYDNLDKTRNELSQAEKRIKTLLHQQVSGAVADELLTNNIDQEVSRKFVCIMFLDIRGFTPFAETRNPEEIIKYQNDIFGFMIDIIHRHNGIINQFLGDGFMATFGAPVSKGNDSDNAFQAATEIIGTLNKRNKDNEIPHTKVGIGLHSGPVVTGNVGTNERKQYSITGNTVILASRIEQLNKEFGTQLLMSEDVYNNLSTANKQQMDAVDVMVKGRKEAIKVFKVA